MKFNIGKMVNVNVSTYENPALDSTYESMRYEADELNLEYDDIDDGLDFESFKKDLSEKFKHELKHVSIDGLNIKKIFKKYGLDWTGNVEFYTPKAYNYENDSVDVEINCVDNDWTIEKYGLTEFVQKYIDDVRQKSYDGYCSFEPSDIKNVERNDYCVLWAIIQKENLTDGIREALEDVIELYSEIAMDNCINPVYEKIVRNDSGEYVGRDKYIIDYDEEKLVKITE